MAFLGVKFYIFLSCLWSLWHRVSLHYWASFFCGSLDAWALITLTLLSVVLLVRQCEVGDSIFLSYTIFSLSLIWLHFVLWLISKVCWQCLKSVHYVATYVSLVWDCNSVILWWVRQVVHHSCIYIYIRV